MQPILVLHGVILEQEHIVLITVQVLLLVLVQNMKQKQLHLAFHLALLMFQQSDFQDLLLDRIAGMVLPIESTLLLAHIII